MVQLNKILVAFDGSQNGIKALEIAKKITRDNKAQLTVIYVHDDPFEHTIRVSKTESGDEYMYLEPGPLINQPIAPVEEKVVVMDEMSDRIILLANAKLSGLQNVNYESFTGDPAEEIVNYAELHNTDLIIIGNRGLSGFKKLVSGSVSKKVFKEATCSVFIVK